MQMKTAGPCAVACLLLLSGVNASAGVITSLGTSDLPGFSTGSIGPIGANPASNNDNTSTPSANTLPYNIFFNSPGLMEVEFNVAASAGTTEYFVPQTFFNNSQQVWTGFDFELGFGTGVSFVRSGSGDELDFDKPESDPPPFSTGFANLDHQEDTINWSGGAIPSIGVLVFRFAIDVPDNLQNFHPGGVNSFTLRQTPVTADAVPEPASIGLIGAGLVVLAAQQRLRRRRS